MARHFTGVDDNYVDLGDVTDARFLSSQEWTILWFARPTNIDADDDKAMVSKFDGGGDPDSMFSVRIEEEPNPSGVRLYTGPNDDDITVDSMVSDDTWYLFSVTNDGTGGSNGVTLRVYGMDGSLIDSGSMTHGGNASDLTRSIIIGGRAGGTNDMFEGDIAHVAYIKAELSASELTSYLFNPVQVVGYYGSASVSFYLPLNGVAGDGGTEPDLSGNENHGTVEGSASSRADNPPVRVSTNLVDAGNYIPIATATTNFEVDLNAATLAAAAQDLVVQVGGVTVNLNPATGAAQPQAMTVGNGVTINLNEATLVASPQALTVQAGAVTLDLNAAIAAASAQSMNVQAGGVSASLNPATLAGQPQTITPNNGITISLNPATMTGQPQTLSITAGDVTAVLNVATLLGQPQAMSVQAGAISINLSEIVAAASAQPLIISNGQSVSLNSASLTGMAQPITITVGNASVALNAAESRLIALAMPGISANGVYDAVEHVAAQSSPPHTRIDFEWAYASLAQHGREIRDANMSMPAYHIGDVAPSYAERGATYGGLGLTHLATDEFKNRWNANGVTIFMRVKVQDPANTVTLFDFDLSGDTGNAYPRIKLDLSSGGSGTMYYYVSATETFTDTVSGWHLALDWVTIAVGFVAGGTPRAQHFVADPDYDVDDEENHTVTTAWASQSVKVAQIGGGDRPDLSFSGDVRDVVVVWDSMTYVDMKAMVTDVYHADNVTAVSLASQLQHSNFAYWQMGKTLPVRSLTNTVTTPLEAYKVHDHPIGWRFLGGSYARLFDGDTGDYADMIGTEGTIMMRFKHADDDAAARTLLYLCDGSTLEVHIYAGSGDGTGLIYITVTYGGNKWTERISADFTYQWTAVVLRWGADGNEVAFQKGTALFSYLYGGTGDTASGSVPANVKGYIGAKDVASLSPTEPMEHVLTHFGWVNRRMADNDVSAALNQLYAGKLNRGEMAAYARGRRYAAWDFTNRGQLNRTIYDHGFHHTPVEHNEHVVLGTNGAYFKQVSSSPVLGGQSWFPTADMEAQRGFVRLGNLTIRARVGKSGWSSFAGYFYFARIRATSGGAQSGEIAIRYNGNTQQLEFIYSGGTGGSQQDRIYAMDITTTDWFIASVDGRYFHIDGMTAYFEGASVGTGSNVTETWSGSYDQATCYIGDGGASGFSCWISDVIIADNNVGSGIDRLTARLHSQSIDDADLRDHFQTTKRFSRWNFTTDYLRYAVDHLEIDRSYDAGITWERLIRHWPIGQRQYTDGGLVPGHIYDYRLVVSGNDKGDSDPLGAAESTTGSAPVSRWIKPELAIIVSERPFSPAIQEDWTAFVKSAVASSGDHGFEGAQVTVELPLYQAVAWKQRKIGFMRIVDDAGDTVWAGRMEVIGVEESVLRVSCFGMWRTFSDAPYTSFWADRETGLWYTLTSDDLPAAAQSQIVSGLFVTDQNNRLNMELQAATKYPMDTRYLWGYQVPHRSTNNVKRVSFTYDVNLATGWQLAVQGVSNDGEATWDIAATVWTLNGNGANQTGSVTLTATELGASGYPRVVVALIRTGATFTFAGNNGDEYAKLTNVQLKGADSSTIDRGAIVRDVVTAVNALSPNWSSPMTTRVIDTGSDMQTNAIFEDIIAAELITSLITSEGNADLVAKVDEDGVLHFTSTDTPRTWYVDIADLDLVEDLSDYVSQSYAQYSNPDGGIARTSVATSAAGELERAGLARQEVAIVTTTSLSFAEQVRDAALADKASGITRARLTIGRIEGSDGAYYPLYSVRGRDKIVIRSVPPFLGEDNSRFVVGRAEFNLMGGLLSVESLEPLPQLQALLAQANS